MAPLVDILKIAQYNLKIILGWNLAAALGICAVVFLVFDLNYLSHRDISQIGEHFLSITGIIILSGLGDIEEKTNTIEIVCVKMRSQLFIFLLRLVLAAGLVFLMIFVVVFYGKLRNGSFDPGIVTWGVFISAIYLGMIGLIAANLRREPAFGYIAAFGYFMFEYFTKGKYTSSFYVFSLLKQDFKPKYYILAVMLILFTIYFSRLRYKYLKGTMV